MVENTDVGVEVSDLGFLDGVEESLESINISNPGSFLSKIELNKDHTTRLFCWLIEFRVLSPLKSTWFSSISILVNSYNHYRKTYLGDYDTNPLVLLPESVSNVIKIDIERSLSWFRDMAFVLQILQDDTQLVTIHAHRVFALLSFNVNQFRYIQGYDRYFMISYLLALYFVTRNGLLIDLAEVFAYPLCLHLIKIGGISNYLDNPIQTQSHFAQLDELVQMHSPTTAALLSEFGHSSLHYAVRWELLLFADEYDISSIFYLWDKFIFHRNQIEKVLLNMCVAHVLQVPLCQNGEFMVETIQRYRGFDCVTATKTAFDLLNGKRNKMVVSKVAFVALVAIIVLALFYRILM